MNIIKGLVAHVPGIELIALCRAQAEFHRERSEAHKAAADALQDVVAAELQYGTAIAAANLALEAAAKACELQNYAEPTPDVCAAAIRAMRVK